MVLYPWRAHTHTLTNLTIPFLYWSLKLASRVLAHVTSFSVDEIETDVDTLSIPSSYWFWSVTTFQSKHVWQSFHLLRFQKLVYFFELQGPWRFQFTCVNWFWVLLGKLPSLHSAQLHSKFMPLKLAFRTATFFGTPRIIELVSIDPLAPPSIVTVLKCRLQKSAESSYFPADFSLFA